LRPKAALWTEHGATTRYEIVNLSSTELVLKQKQPAAASPLKDGVAHAYSFTLSKP